MDTKSFLENVRKEINSAMSKAFDKVEEISKQTKLKLKIGSLKSSIKDVKTSMGDFVFSNKEEFANYPTLAEYVAKIEEMLKMINQLEMEIEELKEKGEDESE